MRVEPDQSEMFSTTAEGLSHSRNRTDRNRVISNEYERRSTFFLYMEHHLREIGTGVCNLVEILCVRIAEMLRLGNEDANVAKILNVIAQFLKPFIQVRISQRRRSHIHTAPIGPQIH